MRRVQVTHGAVRLISILGIGVLGGCVMHDASGSAPQAREVPTVAFDAGAATAPVSGRVRLTSAQLESARVHVPAGTEAFLAGRAEAGRPGILAWYSVSAGRLVATLDVEVTDAPDTPRDGVSVIAGAAHDGMAPALIGVHSTETAEPLLQPPGNVTLRGSHDNRSFDAAPLLSYEGSSHLLALAPKAAESSLSSPQFKAEVRDGSGKTVYAKDMPALGGRTPPMTTIRTTRTNTPTAVNVYNGADRPALIRVKPGAPSVTWESGDAEPRAELVQPRKRWTPGSVRSPAPGVFPLEIGAVHVESVADGFGRAGDWADGVVPAENGAATIEGIAAGRVVGLQVRGNAAEGALCPTPTVAGQPRISSGGKDLKPVAIALGGLAAVGTAWVILRDSSGETHEEEVRFISVTSPGPQEDAGVRFMPVAGGSTLAMLQQDRKAGATLADALCKLSREQLRTLIDSLIKGAEKKLAKDGLGDQQQKALKNLINDLKAAKEAIPGRGDYQNAKLLVHEAFRRYLGATYAGGKMGPVIKAALDLLQEVAGVATGGGAGAKEFKDMLEALKEMIKQLGELAGVEKEVIDDLLKEAGTMDP